MNEELVRILTQSFDVGDKHLAIIQRLENNALTAEALCKSTGIPQGRIYDYLQFLVDAGLVQKTAKRPYRYSIPDLKKNLVAFTQRSVDKLVQRQSEMMYLLKQDKLPAIATLSNAMLVTQTHISLLTEAQTFRIICIGGSYPYILYPTEFKAFIKLREMVASVRSTISHAGNDVAPLMHRAYVDALRQGRRILVLFDRKTFDFHMALFREKLGNNGFVRLLRENLDRLDKYHAQAYVMSDISPLQIDINEKKVCVSMRYLGTSSGLSMGHEDVVAFYQRFFDQKLSAATDVRELLREELENV
jgi:predicted transcriptional regulator